MSAPIQPFRGFSQQIKFRVLACSDLHTSTHLDGGLKGNVACHHDMRPGQEFVAVDAHELDELRAHHAALLAENERLGGALDRIGEAVRLLQETAKRDA